MARVIYCDASPTKACYVIGNHANKYHITNFVGRLNNTVAELKAIIIAMGSISGNLIIYTDNQTVVKMINEKIPTSNGKYYELMNRFYDLRKDRKICINWISRNENPAGKILDRIKRNYKYRI